MYDIVQLMLPYIANKNNPIYSDVCENISGFSIICWDLLSISSRLLLPHSFFPRRSFLYLAMFLSNIRTIFQFPTPTSYDSLTKKYNTNYKSGKIFLLETLLLSQDISSQDVRLTIHSTNTKQLYKSEETLLLLRLSSCLRIFLLRRNSTKT